MDEWSAVSSVSSLGFSITSVSLGVFYLCVLVSGLEIIWE